MTIDPASTLPGLTQNRITSTSSSIFVDLSGLAFSPALDVLLDVAFVQTALALNPNLVGLAQTQNQRAIANGLTNAFNNAALGMVAAPFIWSREVEQPDVREASSSH